MLFNELALISFQAEFFNNYLRDCERPMPLEASIKSSMLPPNPKTPSAEESPTLGMISPLGGTPASGGIGAAWGQDAQMMHMFGRGEWVWFVSSCLDHIWHRWKWEGIW